MLDKFIDYLCKDRFSISELIGFSFIVGGTNFIFKATGVIILLINLLYCLSIGGES